LSGVYSRNKLIDRLYRDGMEDLPVLEDDVSVERSVSLSLLENYETTIEEDWPEFIKDFAC
jgi:hypothetical protein